MSETPDDPPSRRSSSPAERTPSQHAAGIALKEERRRSGASLLAFGSFALAIALVAAAYFLFVRPKPEAPPAGQVADNVSTSSTAPVAKKPSPSEEPATEPTPAAPASIPPTDALTSATDATIKMAKASFVEGEPIVLTVRGLPGNDQDYVALAALGATARDYLTYQYGEKKSDATLSFRPIERAGRYEARAIFADSVERIRGRTTFEVVPAPPVTLSLDKAVYAEGEPIAATVEGLPGNDRDLLAIAATGTPQDKYITYEYAHGTKSGVIKLRPLMTPGRYEARVFFDDTIENGLMRAIVPFEVIALPAPVLSLDRPSFAVGEAITGHFANMPENHDDWLATAQVMQPDGEYLRYVYTGAAKGGAFSIPSTMAEGEFEVRAYFADSTGDKTVRARVAFHVTAAVTPVLTMAPGAVTAGDRLVVGFGAMPGNEKDWISLAAAGAPDQEFLTYRYTGGGKDGSLDFVAPNAPGQYEARAYFDDATGDRVVRARVPFTVLGDSRPLSPP